MPISTPYGLTPWTTGELRAIHGGISGPRAKHKQGDLDEVLVEAMAPYLRERCRRTDQAIDRVIAWAARVAVVAVASDRLARERGDGRLTLRAYWTEILRKLGDRAVVSRLETAARRGRMAISPMAKRTTTATKTTESTKRTG